MILWHTLSTYFRRTLGKRVQKIPLDAGASCPNRDGTLSRDGCLFCNAQGAGSGLLGQGMDIATQWRFLQAKYVHTDANRDFLAYFQSFSNTYGTAARLQNLINAVRYLPNNVGVSIGTRPDCVDAQKLDILAACSLPEVWIEYGLQSCHNTSLVRINRQHSVKDAEKAIYMAAERRIKVCGHLMAGLPGESAEDFLDTVRWAATLPLNGIKLHSLYVCHQSPLEQWYAQGKYIPITMDAYVDMVARALPLIPTHIVMHRLTGDPAPGECVAPEWMLEKRPFFTALYHHMKERHLWQGCQNDAVQARPEWFGR